RDGLIDRRKQAARDELLLRNVMPLAFDRDLLLLRDGHGRARAPRPSTRAWPIRNGAGRRHGAAAKLLEGLFYAAHAPTPSNMRRSAGPTDGASATAAPVQTTSSTNAVLQATASARRLATTSAGRIIVIEPITG